MNSQIETNVDCPICMEAIEMTKNYTTTECGHCFHTKCLMQSVAHNGFGCPYCRTKMADEPEPDEDSEWSEVDDEEAEPFDDSALNGLRWLMMRSEGEEIPEDDVEEEEEEEETDEPEVPAIPKPSASYIAEKLMRRGITFEDMVKVLLLQHEEYENESEDHETTDDKIFGEMRIIISNFTREQEQAAN